MIKALALMVPLALVVAGCVQPPEEVDAATVPDATAIAMQDPLVVSEEGSFGAEAFACAAVICTGRSIVPAERIFETAAKGAVDIEITMEWTAETPHTESMYFGFFTCDPEDCDSDEKLTRIEYVDGTSPLVFTLDHVEIAEGETLYLFANLQAAISGAPAYARVATPQDFHLEGTLTPVTPWDTTAETPSAQP